MASGECQWMNFTKIKVDHTYDLSGWCSGYMCLILTGWWFRFFTGWKKPQVHRPSG